MKLRYIKKGEKNESIFMVSSAFFVFPHYIHEVLVPYGHQVLCIGEFQFSMRVVEFCLF